MQIETIKLVEKLASLVENKGLFIATAESCTAGLISAYLTEVSGASGWFDRGFVTYTNQAKKDLLGVTDYVLGRYGAVSAECVSQMLQGAIKNSNAAVAVAVSGIAGPTGAVPGKPVGTVFIGWIRKDEMPNIRRCHFDGNRDDVREQTCKVAIEGLIDMF